MKNEIIKLTKKYKTLLNNNEINTPLRLAHFWAQIVHESRLKLVGENLNYSAKGLLSTFSKYFTTQSAIKYARLPRLIGNKVYSNRMGNGDEFSGDGYKYRGRGFIQITGKNNYKLLSDYLNVDFVENPELLLEEANAISSTIWFFDVNKINELSDNDDIIAVTKKINGGINGLDERNKLLKEFKKIKWDEII